MPQIRRGNWTKLLNLQICFGLSSPANLAAHCKNEKFGKIITLQFINGFSKNEIDEASFTKWHTIVFRFWIALEQHKTCLRSRLEGQFYWNLRHYIIRPYCTLDHTVTSACKRATSVWHVYSSEVLLSPKSNLKGEGNVFSNAKYPSSHTRSKPTVERAQPRRVNDVDLELL